MPSYHIIGYQNLFEYSCFFQLTRNYMGHQWSGKTSLLGNDVPGWWKFGLIYIYIYIRVQDYERKVFKELQAII